MSVSTIDVLSRHRDRVTDVLALDAEHVPDLAGVLEALPDPRRRQGRRYRLGALLAVCATAVLAGATTLAAIARFAAGLDSGLRARIGLAGGIPRASTLGRLLARLDGDALDAAVGTWLADQLAGPGLTPAAADGAAAGPVPPPAVAVDGKSLRGSRTARTPAVHLLAATVHGARTVIAQRQVDAKSNEITAFRPLLEIPRPDRHRGHLRRPAHPARSRPLPHREEAGALHRPGQGQPVRHEAL